MTYAKRLCCLGCLQKKSVENTYTEKFYKDLLKKHVYPTAKGLHLKAGVTDFTNDTEHIEVKRWDSWKDALGHMLVIREEAHREKSRVYFYGTLSEDTKALATKYLNQWGIDVQELRVRNDDRRVDVVEWPSGFINKSIPFE